MGDDKTSKNDGKQLQNPPKPTNTSMERSEFPLSGSATGTVRNKVALKPGHSLLDWIKLGHSGKDLTGVGGVYQIVTLEELSKHNKINDAWIAIKGQVYNVTHYFDFHPGGPDELLKGVGIDATRMFNEVHAWVNVESMLQKCLVGRLKPSLKDGKSLRPKEALGQILFSRHKKNENSSKRDNLGKVDSSKSAQSLGFSLPLFDWYQKLDLFTFLLYTQRPGIGDSPPCITVTFKEELLVEAKVRIIKRGIPCLCLFHVFLNETIEWPCSINLIADIGKVEIIFKKKVCKIWKNLKNPSVIGPEVKEKKTVLENGQKEMLNLKDEEEIESAAESDSEVETVFHELRVEDISPINHDTKLFALKYTKKVCESIPIGYHVQVQVNVKGMILKRYYTPVVPALHISFWPPSVASKENSNGPIPPDAQNNWLFLLIKSTEGGAVSPFLCDGGVNIGDNLLVSEGIAPTVSNPKLQVPPPFHMGSSPILSSQKPLHILLLAAGSGLTPMARIIVWSLKLQPSQCEKITLIFFNKTEKDIIWREQLDKLTEDCDRFTLKYVLSNPEVGWKGETGVIRHELLETYFSPKNSSLLHLNIYTCTCGPVQFTRAAERILHDLDVKATNYFSFLG